MLQHGIMIGQSVDQHFCHKRLRAADQGWKEVDASTHHKYYDASVGGRRLRASALGWGARERRFQGLGIALAVTVAAHGGLWPQNLHGFPQETFGQLVEKARACAS